MRLPLLDSNVLLRHLTQDHPNHSPRSTALFASITQNETRVRVSDVMLFEASFTLLGMYHATRAEVRDGLARVINLPGVHLPRKGWWPRIFELFTSSTLSLPDSYHVVMMRHLGITKIISFDTDFDAISDITLTEP